MNKKVIRILMIVGLLLISVDKINAQKINDSFPEETLVSRIERIKKNSEARITFNTEQIKDIHIPALIVVNLTVEQVLDKSLSTTVLAYKKVSNNLYAIVRKNSSAPRSTASATLHGRIVESETSEPLPGAVIRLSDKQFVVSDMNGYYSFPKVANGKWVMEVSYVGFKPEKMEITVKAGENTYDIKMSGSTLLSEVEVRGVKRTRSAVPHTTEKLLVAEIKGLSVVASGISSEQISKSADRNAAEVVKKIAGITIRDNKFIVIRGLNERYNLTYLNDNVAPSTELYSRAFALDLIPSRIIDRILVYKSPAPELLGDITGGAVKIYTKDAQNVRHFDIEVQTGYRPHTTFNKDFLTYQGGKYDFLGFDDGTRKLPSSVPGYGDFTKATSSQQTYAKSFNPTLQYGYMTGLPLMQLTANYYNTIRVGGKSLSMLGSLSYKNESLQNDISRMQVSSNPGSSSTLSPAYSRFDEVQSTQTAQLTWLQNFTYRINDNSSIAFKNFLLQQGQSSVVDRTQYNSQQYGYYVNGSGANYGVADNVPLWTDFSGTAKNDRNIVLNYMQRFLYSGNLGGTHHLGGNGKHLLQWNAGYMYSRQDIPDQRVINLQQGYSNSNVNYMDYRAGNQPSLDWVSAVRSVDDGEFGSSANDVAKGIISRTWTRNSEMNYTASADYTYKWNPLLTLKAGTYQQWKQRVLFRRVYTLNEGDLNSAGYPNSTLLAADGRYMDYNLVFFKEQDLGKVWSTDYLRDDGSALKVFDRTSGSDAYTATEQNNSGYVAANYQPFGDKLDIYGGLRVEYDRQKVAGAIPQSQGGLNFPLLVDIGKLDWLPSLNISYRPTDNWVLRGSYGKTVNRPEFRELSPYSELDYLNNQTIQGNSTLQPASIDNYDLRAEWYPGRANTISLGAFYKKLVNPIERILYRDLNYSGSPTAISFANAQEGTVRGLELDIRQQLDFIPLGIFRNLSIIANGTLIKSEVTKSDSTGGNGVTTFKYKRSLQGQAPYILNAGLYYDNAASGTKAAIIYNYIGPSIYAASAGKAPNGSSQGNYTQAGYAGSQLELGRGQLDISVTQRIVRGLQVKFSVQNLLNTSIQMAEDQNFTYKYEKAVYTAPTYALTPGQLNATYIVSGDPISSSYKIYPYFNATFTYSF